MSENKCLITNQYLFAIAPAIQIYYFCAESLVPDDERYLLFNQYEMADMHIAVVS